MALCRGWEEIAAYLRRPVSTTRTWAKEMERNEVIFYAQVGSPPRKVVCAFKEDLKRWYKRRSHKDTEAEEEDKEVHDAFAFYPI